MIMYAGFFIIRRTTAHRVSRDRRKLAAAMLPTILLRKIVRFGLLRVRMQLTAALPRKLQEPSDGFVWRRSSTRHVILTKSPKQVIGVKTARLQAVSRYAATAFCEEGGATERLSADFL